MRNRKNINILHLYEQGGNDLHQKLAGRLQADRYIDIFHPGRIAPGLNTSQELNTYANNADIILIFFSYDFLTSDIARSDAMATVIRRLQAQEVRVVPILIQPVDLTQTPFHNVQALPSAHTSFDELYAREEREKAVQDIVREISNLAYRIRIAQYVEDGHQVRADEKYADALASYRQALLLLQRRPFRDRNKELEDLEFELYCSIGDIYSLLNLFPEAAEAYGHASQLDLQNALIYERLGDVSFKQTNIDEALQYYKRVFELKGPDARLYKKNADCYVEKEAYQEAISFYKQAQRYGSEDGSIHRSLGDCYFHLQSYEEALGAYRQVLQSTPDDVYCLKQSNLCLEQLRIAHLSGNQRTNEPLPIGLQTRDLKLETGELQASEQKPAKVSPDEEKIFSLPKPRFGFLLHLSKRAAVIICLLLFVLIFAPILFIVRNNPASHSGDGRTVPDPISVISQDGTLVGMSDGRYVFDTNRTDGTTKLAAAEQMRKKNFVGASQLFEAASKNDPGDAEALIYREDLRVLASQRPYITLVVTTVFSANDVPISQATLQGAYVAQKEFNDGFKLHNNYQVYLLIANSVSGQKNASTTVKVAQQIVTLSQKDKTFFAMVGWPYSVDMQAALPVLKQHTIPVVSAIASSDALSGSSPYFFRTCPTNTAYGIAGANYSINTLHAKRAVIFVDPHDSYSGTLADAFKKQFEADGGVVVRTENYTARDPSTIPPLSDIPANLAYDLIYFSGIASDISAFLTNLPPGNVPIMGGSGSYLLGDYRESALPQLTRLHFTSPAYPDEWTILGLDAYTPAFFREYPHDFDPSGKSPNAYGHGRPTYESILAYDGMLALLTAANNALADPDHRLLSPQNVRWGLTQINQQHPLAGASGQIAFDVHGDPVDKAILSVHVVQDGSSQFFKMDSLIQGKLS